jgi:hypothetical protein
MPRELYPDDRGRLCQRPAGKVVDAYRNMVLRLDDGPQPGQAVDVPPNCMMHCRIKAGAPNAEAVVALRYTADAPDAGYRFRIRFGDKTVTLGDRYRSYQRECDFDAGAPIDVADTVIECFLNDAYCFTMRAYDFPSGGLMIDAASGKITVADFEVRTLAQ